MLDYGGKLQKNLLKYKLVTSEDEENGRREQKTDVYLKTSLVELSDAPYQVLQVRGCSEFLSPTTLDHRAILAVNVHYFQEKEIMTPVLASVTHW